MSKTVTPDLLLRRALHYLERYSASESGVRTILRRGLKRDQERGIIIPPEVDAWIEATLLKLKEKSYLNDISFAETKLVSLRRSGASTQKIKQKLALKGVAPEVVGQVLEADESSDAAAALAFARRRRLGVFCDADKRADKRDKHIASLARAGFALSLARQIVDAETCEALIEFFENND